MKNIHEWRLDKDIDGLQQEFNLGKAARVMGSTGGVESYESMYYRYLARPIDRLVQMQIAAATKADPSLSDDPAKLVGIKQEIMRDILGVASNVVTNGLNSGSRTKTNFRAAGSNFDSQ